MQNNFACTKSKIHFLKKLKKKTNIILQKKCYGFFPCTWDTICRTKLFINMFCLNHSVNKIYVLMLPFEEVRVCRSFGRPHRFR